MSISSVSNNSNNNNINNCYNNNVNNKNVMQLNASANHSMMTPLQFNEIGPIPPPRMFSDTVLLTISNNTSNAYHNDNNNNDNDSNMDSTNDNSHNKTLPISEPTEVPQMSSLPICVIRSQFINEPISVIEEVPTKEPQLSAVPKKSALKKPRIAPAMSCPTNTSSSNEIHSQQTSSPALSHSSIVANTSTSPMLIRPQPTPRYTYNSMPIQIVATTAQHNSPLANQNYNNNK